jgi:protein-disulfide isomerase
MRALLLMLSLGAALLAGGPARAQTALTQPDVERIVRDYLLKNPEVIYDALQELQRRREADEAKRQQAAITQHRDAIFADAGDPVGGNPKGDVTLVEFFDYRCGYCRSMAGGLRSLMASDKQLRFVFKDLPILSPESTLAARAALAAEKQGKYSAMHFAMMQAKDLSRDAIMAIAHEQGLDPDRLARDMDAGDITTRLDENMRLAQALGVNGTPAFVLGNQLIPGAAEIGQLAQLIGQQRAAGN